MINDYDTETLELHKANVAEKEQALDKAKTGRDDFIREMLDKGAKPTELSRVSSLSRERIYQIKERRR